MDRVAKFDDETILSLFGAQAAEDEDPERLKSYFVRNKAYDRARAEIPLRILVGHKGIGKSAILVVSYQEDLQDNILSLWLKPTDLSKAWSVDGSFVERVEGIKGNILRLIAEKSLEKMNILGFEVSKTPILTSVKQLSNVLLRKINEASEATIDEKIVSNFKASQRINIYVDDIDRGWAATKRDIENISALINAARDLTNENSKIKFLIGLRTDAYNLVRENDESGDKIEPYVIPVSWTNHDILVIVAKRVANYFEVVIEAEELEKQSQVEISRHLYPVIVERFSGSGHWAKRRIHNVLLSLTRRRPRDLVKLLSGAAVEAEKRGKNKIETVDLESSFPEYSKARIGDLVSEFQSELSQLERVIYSMKPTARESREKEKRFQYRNDELIAKLNGIGKNQNIVFGNRNVATGQALAEFLFKIDFVIARRESDEQIERYYYEDHSKLQTNFVDFGFSWEVHPAYRWALNPTRVRDLFMEID